MRVCESVLDIMHGRSRKTINPRIPNPYNAGDGARQVFTDQADIAASRMIGELLSTKNRL